MTQPFGQGTYFDQLYHPPSAKPELTHRERMLAALLGSDAQTECNQAVRYANQGLREMIRSVTALRLHDGEDRAVISVRVSDGLPAPFASAIDEFDELLWWITLHRPALTAARTGLAAAKRRAPELFDLAFGRSTLDEHVAAVETIDLVHGFLESVLAIEQQRELEQRIAAIEVDVLGAYFFRQRKVEIYWLVVGAFARILGVPIRDLATVVLCHELIHAFTHVGRDIDRRQWLTDDFAASDIHIVEGLAQYYTALVCDRIAGRDPGPKRAFESLLEIQPMAYTEFREWFKTTDRCHAEAVRSVMLHCRSSAPVPYQGFLDQIRRETTRVREMDRRQTRMF